LDYVQKKGYLEIGKNTGLSYGRPTPDSKVFKVLDPLSEEDKSKKIELM